MPATGTSADSSPSDDAYAQLAPLFAELRDLPEENPRRTELRDELVTGYLPVAKHIAQRFSNRGEPQDDLVQVATVGLINAVDRFDAERGTDFLSFAVPTIMGEVRRYFRDSSWSMRVPRRLKELHLAISGANSRLSQSLGRAPTPSEIAEDLKLSKEEVFEGLEAGNAYSTASLDGMLQDQDSGMSLGDSLGEEDSELDGVELREVLEPVLRDLPQRERTILLLRFFANMTQTQIAERVGLSQMHVSRLLAKTLRKLRTTMVR
ncbi:SigB/SigF/SigG family RNA polymerase sigma factor [Pseudonocardiaceae bacterium YIM PH 21723]|nr:SigB/SigF/SigG family RNA polymerase sigma factor [Pseudonocardiaceae bacterium YIM PH 21723]